MREFRYIFVVWTIVLLHCGCVLFAAEGVDADAAKKVIDYQVDVTKKALSSLKLQSAMQEQQMQMSALPRIDKLLKEGKLMGFEGLDAPFSKAKDAMKKGEASVSFASTKLPQQLEKKLFAYLNNRVKLHKRELKKLGISRHKKVVETMQRLDSVIETVFSTLNGDENDKTKVQKYWKKMRSSLSYAPAPAIEEEELTELFFKFPRFDNGILPSTKGLVLWVDATRLKVKGRASQLSVVTNSSFKGTRLVAEKGVKFIPDKVNGRPALFFEGNSATCQMDEKITPLTVFAVHTNAGNKKKTTIAGNFKGKGSWKMLCPDSRKLKVNVPMINHMSIAKGALNEFSIGKPAAKNSSWEGALSELIIYNRKMSTKEVAEVKTYLSNKWLIRL